MSQNPHQALYGSRRWRRAALRQLAAFPCCQGECARSGLVVAAQECDHHVRHGGNPRLFWDPSNHRSLCRACHQAKSAEEERHARLGFELDVDEDGFPLDENWGISRSRSAGKASFSSENRTPELELCAIATKLRTTTGACARRRKFLFPAARVPWLRGMVAAPCSLGGPRKPNEIKWVRGAWLQFLSVATASAGCGRALPRFERIIQSEKSPCQNHYNRRHNRASPLSQTAEPEFHPLGTLAEPGMALWRELHLRSCQS